MGDCWPFQFCAIFLAFFRLSCVAIWAHLWESRDRAFYISWVLKEYRETVNRKAEREKSCNGMEIWMGAVSISIESMPVHPDRAACLPQSCVSACLLPPHCFCLLFHFLSISSFSIHLLLSFCTICSLQHSCTAIQSIHSLLVSCIIRIFNL